jgi:hypothetical protein
MVTACGGVGVLISICLPRHFYKLVGGHSFIGGGGWLVGWLAVIASLFEKIAHCLK